MPEMPSFRAGLVQLRSGRNVAKNIAEAEALIRAAARQGALYVQTPEGTALMEVDDEALFAAAEPEQGSAALAAFSALARELRLWLHIGAMAVRVAQDKLANRSFLLSPEGQVAATYDKIHLFDVALASGETFTESLNYVPGSRAVTADLPLGRIGLTICYDLRFPQLYRALARAGARFLAVPSAFTRITGAAHWHTLLKARAIENQCFVFAAAQGGRHEHGRETYGHSLVVSPWGDILAEGGIEPGVVVADIDLAVLDDFRRRVPSLSHDRPFDMPPVLQK